MLKSLALVSCLFTACASPQALRPGDLPPIVSRVSPEQRVATWNRAIGVLLDEGYVPEVLNQDGGYISAKRRDDGSDTDELAGTFSIVMIAPDGVVRVEIAGGGVYSDVNKLAHDLRAIQERLAAKIAQPAPLPPPTAPQS